MGINIIKNSLKSFIIATGLHITVVDATEKIKEQCTKIYYDCKNENGIECVSKNYVIKNKEGKYIIETENGYYHLKNKGKISEININDEEPIEFETINLGGGICIITKEL